MGGLRHQRPNNNVIGMPNFKFTHSAAEHNSKHALQTQTISDRLDTQLSQNLALILLDKNYESCESHALYALTAIMKDYLQEIGKEIKQNAEMQGRAEPNLCDMLAACYDYGHDQKQLVQHMKAQELTLEPM